MNRKIMVVVVGLLALGALEFGLLGASAAGLVGGSEQGLPPIPQRGNVEETATPVPTSTPEGGMPGPHSIELLRPNPDAIECDGAHASEIHVFVRDSTGSPVEEGTVVRFSVFNGSASPGAALTGPDGAHTSVVLYSDAYSQQPNIVVSAGDMETAVRLRCKPNSDCPVSPPSSMSPPCATPPATPYPCNPSPGSGWLSPPCATPEPCNPSPGSGEMSPPCATETPPSPPECNPSPGGHPMSPPCATPVPPSPPECNPFGPPCITPTPNPCVDFLSPPPADDCNNTMRVDADPATSGLQTIRTVSDDQPFGIGINVTRAGDPYNGYQWAIEFPADALAFVSATEQTANTAMELCAEAGNVSSDITMVRMYGGCLSFDTHYTTQFEGEVTSVELRCLAEGQFEVRLVATYNGDLFASSLLRGGGIELGTAVTGIIVECNDDGGTIPTPKHGVGGEIYFGTPDVIDGKIRLPVNTTAAQDLFRGFNVSFEFDSAMASIASLNSDAALGPLFTGNMSCNRATVAGAPGATRVVMACSTQGAESPPTLGPGTMAYIWLTPLSTGCLKLHLTSYDAPDFGGVLFGNFTVDFAAFAVQANSYGPDVHVNTADGAECIGSCISFPPGECGPDDTPTSAAPTSTPTPKPAATVVRTASPAPSRTVTPSAPACADVTGDGRVTQADVAFVVRNVFKRRPDRRADVNGDGRVNFKDVGVVTRQLGRRC